MYTVKKVSGFPVPSRDVTNQSLPGRELFNYSPPGRVWLVTFLLGTGKPLTFFYSVLVALGMNFMSCHPSVGFSRTKQHQHPGGHKEMSSVYLF